MDVTAVVVNWNGEDYLPACLEALRALDLVEVIVVDNASTDGSLALLAERFPEARVVQVGENDGPARARNVGMEAARTRWVLALDNDVVVPPGLLGALAAAAESRPGVAAVQPRSVFADAPDRVHYDGGGLHYAGLFSLRNWYRPLAEADGQGVVEVGGFVSLCALVDRQALLALGGYDERYFILFEDLDLSHRLRLAGHSILCAEDTPVLHDAGTPGISFREGSDYPSSRVFYHSRNRWLYMAKCYSWWTLLLASPGLLVYELAWLAFAVRQGGAGAWLRGKLAFLAAWSSTRRLRRQVQGARVVGDRALLVGGPLTLTPSLASPAGRALGRTLGAWWALVRLALR